MIKNQLCYFFIISIPLKSFYKNDFYGGELVYFLYNKTFITGKTLRWHAGKTDNFVTVSLSAHFV